MKNPWIIIGLLTVVLFGGAIWYSSVANERNNEDVELITHQKGNPEASFSLVKYSDFSCPSCAAAAEVVNGLLEEYGDRIVFEYRHFPFISPASTQAAVAAEAAGQQGKFYEYHDVLFANQQQWAQSATPELLFIQYAEQIGLDMTTFRRHLNSSLLRDKVRESMMEGRERGVTATPTFYLNGERVTGYETYQEFIAVVLQEIDPSLVPNTVNQEVTPETSGAPAGSGVRFGL